ncbi:DUF1980 domain-containing protein, partial [Priestia sp. YIM B13446]|uniref:DUF1980 domain-containing protein n=2 Tax=unclassified Priestia TaxID=2800374 RepID=UPI0036721567
MEETKTTFSLRWFSAYETLFNDGFWHSTWYPLYFLPVLTVFFLPVATLDSNIVEAKGF